MRDLFGHQRLPRTSGVRAHESLVILPVARARGVQERLVGRIDRAQQSIEHLGVPQPIGIDRVLEVLLRIREHPMPPGQRPLFSRKIGLLGRDLFGGPALQLRDRRPVGRFCPPHRVPGGAEARGGPGARVAVARGVLGVANHRARDRAFVVQHRDQRPEAVALLLDPAGVGQPSADAGRERPDLTPRLVADVAELPTQPPVPITALPVSKLGFDRLQVRLRSRELTAQCVDRRFRIRDRLRFPLPCIGKLSTRGAKAVNRYSTNGYTTNSSTSSSGNSSSVITDNVVTARGIIARVVPRHYLFQCIDRSLRGVLRLP